MININDAYGVTGNPILHSRSPFIFNEFIKIYPFLSSFYIRFSANNAKESLTIAKKLGLKGFNVTAPFKESIIPYLSQIDNNSEIIGAVNTVKIIENKSIGYNTDFIAIAELIDKYYKNRSSKKALVIGAGGAAKACVYALKKKQFDISIVNRTQEKLKINKIFNGTAHLNIENLGNDIKENFLIINTTPLDLYEYNKYFTAKHVLINAVYHLKSDKQLKCKTVSGFEWLVRQAKHSLKIFTNFDVDVENNQDNNSLKNSFDFKLQTHFKQTKKNNITLIGFIGSGKTVIGKQLAKIMNMDFLDVDEMIQKKEKMSIEDIFANKGEKYFRKVETKMLKSLTNKNNLVISTGGGIIFEQVNRELLKEISNVYWLFTPIKKCIDRIQGRVRPPLLKHNNNSEELNLNAELLFNIRFPYYCEIADAVFYNNSTLSKVVKKIYEEDSLCFGVRR